MEYGSQVAHSAQNIDGMIERRHEKREERKGKNLVSLFTYIRVEEFD